MKYSTNFSRSNLIESTHKIKIMVTDLKGKVLVSSGNEGDFIYPRSSIKVFQAIPFIQCNPKKYYNLSKKNIALACSSHRGEKFHIKELESWIKKIGISEKKLKCGTHNPLDIKASENLFRSNQNPNQLHNNCAGKHLAMITSCLINEYNTNKYLSFNHPHQIKIRKIFEKFTNHKINRKNYGIDGCSAPQYSFKIKDICKMLINLIKSYNDDFYYGNEVKQLINSVIKNPKFIGGTHSLDSIIMGISDVKIFCKGGAEGVFLFADLKNNIVGVIKVVDGNERALPSVVFNIFKKLKILNSSNLKKLKKYYNFNIINHAKIKVGSINTIIS